MRKLKPQGKFGQNVHKQTHKWWLALLIYSKNRCYLLIAVAVIYFVMGQNNEAYFMLAAIVVVSGISFLPGQPQSDCDGSFRKVK
jgi:Ca2+-transporting ATPase